MLFLVFIKGKPSKDELPSGKILIFFKLGTLLQFQGQNYAPKKDHLLRSCSIVKTYKNQLNNILRLQADNIYKTKQELDLYMSCMKSVTELSKLANFSGTRL
jgi:hypothetical protein